MAKSVNQVIVMGNLTRDPELRTTSTGQSVCSFSVAVNRSWTGSDGQQQEDVDFFDVVAWAKLGELVNQYLSKGRRALVMGRLSQRSWEQDGQKRSKVEIVANDVTFLDGPGGGDNSPSSAPSSSSSSSSNNSSNTSSSKSDDDEQKPVDLSDIPF